MTQTRTAKAITKQSSRLADDFSCHRISVVIPCLNEEGTVGRCIDKAHDGCKVALETQINIFRDIDDGSTLSAKKHKQAKYEIIKAVNGSTDDSRKIAVAHNTQVVRVMRKSYGAAALSGIVAAPGNIVVIRLRAFYRHKIMSLNLSCEGMGFASEMMVRAARKERRMAKVPIRLYPDARNLALHMRIVCEGLRNLATLLCSFPKVDFPVRGE